MRVLLIPSPKAMPYSIPFTGREVNKLHPLVTKPLNLLELLSTPKCDASLVERSQVGSLRGPTYIGFCPSLDQKKKYMQRFNFMLDSPKRERIKCVACSITFYKSIY